MLSIFSPPPPTLHQALVTSHMTAKNRENALEGEKRTCLKERAESKSESESEYRERERDRGEREMKEIERGERERERERV